MNKLIEAIKDTREVVIEEHFRGVRHSWSTAHCPLCEYSGFRCEKCPLGIFQTFFNLGCTTLARYPNNNDDTATPQDINDFLYALQKYYEGGQL